MHVAADAQHPPCTPVQTDGPSGPHTRADVRFVVLCTCACTLHQQHQPRQVVACRIYGRLKWLTASVVSPSRAFMMDGRPFVALRTTHRTPSTTYSDSVGTLTLIRDSLGASARRTKRSCRFRRTSPTTAIRSARTHEVVFCGADRELNIL
jgi:hypothetical protein